MKRITIYNSTQSTSYRRYHAWVIETFWSTSPSCTTPRQRTESLRHIIARSLCSSTPETPAHTTELKDSLRLQSQMQVWQGFYQIYLLGASLLRATKDQVFIRKRLAAGIVRISPKVRTLRPIKSLKAKLSLLFHSKKNINLTRFRFLAGVAKSTPSAVSEAFSPRMRERSADLESIRSRRSTNSWPSLSMQGIKHVRLQLQILLPYQVSMPFNQWQIPFLKGLRTRFQCRKHLKILSLITSKSKLTE